MANLKNFIQFINENSKFKSLIIDSLLNYLVSLGTDIVKDISIKPNNNSFYIVIKIDAHYLNYPNDLSIGYWTINSKKIAYIVINIDIPNHLITPESQQLAELGMIPGIPRTYYEIFISARYFNKTTDFKSTVNMPHKDMKLTYIGDTELTSANDIINIINNFKNSSDVYNRGSDWYDDM